MKITIQSLNQFNPLVVKNLGDGCLLVFDKTNIDEKLNTLFDLKNELEAHLSKKKFQNKISFSAHYGSIVVGEIGMKPFLTYDAFGDSINTTFVMNGKPFRNRFNISPQLFRKLESVTRKKFHKFTPPIVYIAE
ncbi:MAG: hypothetical protein MJB14_01590 [Spirochaetes bacterium]|nr:hypothetical protein [Spirochaetota bacterium]